MIAAAASAAITIRAAEAADIPGLQRLIVASARALGRGFYSEAQTEAAIAHVFGVDSELVADGTYLVARAGAALAGCGGWSRRATLFGGDHYAARAEGRLDPARDAARIRAFFVAPEHARRGVGAALLAACEAAAREAGFARVADGDAARRAVLRRARLSRGRAGHARSRRRARALRPDGEVNRCRNTTKRDKWSAFDKRCIESVA